MNSKEKEIFEAYCKSRDINVDYWGNYSEILVKTFSYKSFELSIYMKELKKSIIESLPKCMRGKL